MCDCGLEESYLFKACLSYARNVEVQLILASHVDDLIWACKPSAKHIIAKIKSLLILGTKDLHIFRYCGKEVTQDPGTFSIKITHRATSEKFAEIELPPGRLENLAVETTPEEKEWLSTSVGILVWIARLCRPTFSFNVSKLQGHSRKPLVGDIKTCNTVIRYTLAISEDGIYVHHGLDWNHAVIGYVGDAGVAEGDQVIELQESSGLIGHQMEGFSSWH